MLSSPISIVPDDLLAEVFLRLPHARSATRCTAVCRRWRSIISDHFFGHKFIQRHHDQAHLPHTIMLFLFTDKLFYRIFSDESMKLHGRFNRFSDSFRYLGFLPNHVDAIASAGDLLLVSSPSPTCCQAPPAMEYRLCNPLSRRWIAIPAVAASQDYAVEEARHGLACEPGTVMNESDRIRFRFRIVKLDRFRINGNDNDDGMENENVLGYGLTMFCSEIGEWRGWTMVDTPPAAGRRGTTFGSEDVIATSDGVLYFPLRRRDEQFGGGTLSGFLSFEPFADEARCGFVAMPEGVAHSRPTWFAGAVRGRLRISQCWKRREDVVIRLRIWELKHGGEGDHPSASWGLLIDDKVQTGRVNRGSMFVTGFDPNDGDVIFLVMSSLSEIFKYRLKEQDCETIAQIPPQPVRNCVKEGFSVNPRSLTLVHPAWPTPIPGIDKVDAIFGG